jgi:glycosyltransferase involved in cell wall biosynthesis
MRVAIFSAFFPFRGGIAQFNARLFRSLEKKNQVSAFTFTKQYPGFLFPGKTQFVNEKDQVDEIPAQRIVNPFNPFSYFGAAKKVRNSGSNLFITNYWMTFFGICFGFLARKQRKETTRIALIHNLIPHEPRFFDRFFSRYYVKGHDGFIVMSDVVEKDLLQLKPDARYLKIPHPWYDHFGAKLNREEACRVLGLSPVKINLLFFGLIRDYKGLDILLESFNALSSDYQLIIAGEVYGDSAKYFQQINASKNKERIVFHDRYIADDEVKNYFSAADCCVLPYRSATQSGITAAAFHFEVPVVVTDVGGLRESVESIGAGVVVSTPDPSKLKEGIELLTGNSNLEVFRANIRKAKEGNSWDHFAEALLDFAVSLRK